MSSLLVGRSGGHRTVAADGLCYETHEKTRWHDDRINRLVDDRQAGPKLLDLVRSALRVRHYSVRTERAYCGWIVRYIVYHGKRHPSELGAKDVHSFRLTTLPRCFRT